MRASDGRLFYRAGDRFVAATLVTSPGVSVVEEEELFGGQSVRASSVRSTTRIRTASTSSCCGRRRSRRSWSSATRSPNCAYN